MRDFASKEKVWSNRESYPIVVDLRLPTGVHPFASHTEAVYYQFISVGCMGMHATEDNSVLYFHHGIQGLNSGCQTSECFYPLHILPRLAEGWWGTGISM